MEKKDLYEKNTDFREYVDRYCKKHEITVAEALEHKLVQEVGKQYEEMCSITVQSG